MYCNKCGKEIPDDAKFCKYCGNKISKDKNSKNTGKDDNNTKSRFNTNAVIIIATIIIVLAIIGVTAGHLIYNSGDSNLDVTDSSESSSNDNLNSVDSSNDDNSNNKASSNNDNSKKSSSNGVSKVSLNAFPVSEAPNLAQQIANSGQADSVDFKGVTLNKAQICYILTKSVSMIASGNANGVINVGSPNYAQNPSGVDHSQSISKAKYVDVCTRFSNWIENHGTVPNYVGINAPGVSDISPSNMINICVEILIQYKNTGSLPSSAKV